MPKARFQHDRAGDTVDIVDPHTGEVHGAHLLVAVRHVEDMPPA